MKSLLRHSAWTVIMNIMLALGGLAVSLISARLLGPAGRGSYFGAILISSTAGFISNPCIYASANYFLSSKKGTVQEVMPLVLILNGISALLAFFMALLGIKFLHGDPLLLQQPIWLLLGLGGAAASISVSMNGVFYGSHRVKTIVFWSVFAVLLHATLVIIASIWLTPSVPLFVAIDVTILLSNAIGKTILGGWGVWRQLTLKWDLLRPMLKYGFSVYTGRMLMLCAERIDMYLLLFLVGQEALGYYSISVSFGEQLWMLPSAINLVMMANIADRPDNEAANITVSASQMVIGLTLVGSFVLGTLSFWAIPLLYGAEFSPSVLPFLIMLPGVVAISSYSLQEPYFQSRGQPMIPVKITLGGALANLVASLILIPLFQLPGCALAYSLSYLFQLGLTCYFFARSSRFPAYAPLNLWQLRHQVGEKLQDVRGMRRF